jgi:hypothetical protein
MFPSADSAPSATTANEWRRPNVTPSAGSRTSSSWGPSASAHGVETTGSIGNDGWIRGYGYAVRLNPDWYDVGSDGQPGLQVVLFPFDGGQIELYAAAATPASVADDRAYLRRLGARPMALDGAPGLLLARSGLTAGFARAELAPVAVGWALNRQGPRDRCPRSCAARCGSQSPRGSCLLGAGTGR